MPDPTDTQPSVDLDGASFDSAMAASAPQIGSPAGAVPPAPVPQEPAAPVAEPAQPAEAKPTAEKPVEGGKPKKGLDAITGEKKEEKPAEKPTEETPEPEIDTSKWTKPQQEAFASARVKERRLKEELKEARIKSEKLEREFAEFKKTPRDSEETLKKLQHLETWQKSQELHLSDEWQSTVQKPIENHLGMLGRIAARAGVDADALAKATDETVPFERIDAITRVFEAAETPVPAHLITAAIQEAEKLHGVYEKGMELEKNAKETLSSIHHQTSQQKEAAAKAAEAEYSKHHEHIYSQMADKMPSVFKDEALAKAVKEARPAKDPAEQAFQAQAAELLPTMWTELQTLREQLAAEKASKQALLGARPTIKPATTTTKPLGADDTEMDEAGFDSALRRR